MEGSYSSQKVKKRGERAKKIQPYSDYINLISCIKVSVEEKQCLFPGRNLLTSASNNLYKMLVHKMPSNNEETQ